MRELWKGKIFQLSWECLLRFLLGCICILIWERNCTVFSELSLQCVAARVRALWLSKECRWSTINWKYHEGMREGRLGLCLWGILHRLYTTGCCHCFVGLSPVYAVALAKKNAKQINIHNLRGRRSCHSHLYSPGGWLLLSRYTVGPLENVTENCDIGSGMNRSGLSVRRLLKSKAQCLGFRRNLTLGSKIEKSLWGQSKRISVLHIIEDVRICYDVLLYRALFSVVDFSWTAYDVP